MSQNILIVDDSAVIRQMVKKTLKMADLNVGRVYEASDGIEALATLSDHCVSAVLSGLNMPAMNGLQLLSRMKQNELLKHIPIVILSAEGSQERIKQLEQVGISGYLRKPFQPEQLRVVLTPLLGVKQDAATETNDTHHNLF